MHDKFRDTGFQAYDFNKVHKFRVAIMIVDTQSAFYSDWDLA